MINNYSLNYSSFFHTNIHKIMWRSHLCWQRSVQNTIYRRAVSSCILHTELILTFGLHQSPGQQSGTHCLIHCVIWQSESKRISSLSDIRDVSALEVSLFKGMTPHKSTFTYLLTTAIGVSWSMVPLCGTACRLCYVHRTHHWTYLEINWKLPLQNCPLNAHLRPWRICAV